MEVEPKATHNHNHNPHFFIISFLLFLASSYQTPNSSRNPFPPTLIYLFIYLYLAFPPSPILLVNDSVPKEKEPQLPYHLYTYLHKDSKTTHHNFLLCTHHPYLKLTNLTPHPQFIHLINQAHFLLS